MPGVAGRTRPAPPACRPSPARSRTPRTPRPRTRRRAGRGCSSAGAVGRRGSRSPPRRPRAISGRRTRRSPSRARGRGSAAGRSRRWCRLRERPRAGRPAAPPATPRRRRGAVPPGPRSARGRRRRACPVASCLRSVSARSGARSLVTSSSEVLLLAQGGHGSELPEERDRRRVEVLAALERHRLLHRVHLVVGP